MNDMSLKARIRNLAKEKKHLCAGGPAELSDAALPAPTLRIRIQRQICS